jgi:hypothetical protein
MSLILVEGFDSYSSASETITAELLKTHVVSDTTDDFATSTGRYGGKSLRLPTSSNDWWVWLIPPGKEEHQKWTVGFNYYSPSSVAAANPFLRISQSNTGGASDTIRLQATSNYAFNVTDNSGTVLAATTNNAFTFNTWYHIELQVFCHTTNGTVELRINGSTVASATDVNTATVSAILTYSALIISSPGNVLYTPLIDDVYICDGSGSTNNTFLGVCKVVTLRPTSDAAPNNGTPSTGNDHYALLDEVKPDYSTSYISLTGNGDQEMFGYENLVSTSPVKGICLTTLAATAGAQDTKLKSVMKSGNSSTSFTSKPILGSGYYTAVQHISETNPATSALWTASEVDAGTFGCELEV